MEINYWILAVVCTLVLGLLVWLVKRDRRDEKDFERELIDSELNHEDDNAIKHKHPSTPSKKP